MLRVNLMGLIEPMQISAANKHRTIDPHALKIPAPWGRIYTNGDAFSPFHAEPRQCILIALVADRIPAACRGSPIRFSGQARSCANAGGERPATAVVGDYLLGRAFRRFAGTSLRLLITGFVVSAASNKCRMPCSNSSTALSKAPSCPTRTIATDMCKSKDGGRNTATVSRELFPAMKRAGSSPIP